MKELRIKAPKDIDCDELEWSAVYGVVGKGDAVRIQIESRSAIEVIVAKITMHNLLGEFVEYYISSPNFGIAIPSIGSLQETHWIMEKLIQKDMPAPDAVTIAQVLSDFDDF